MILGEVNERLEAVIEIAIGGSGGTELSLSAIIDTGFNGSLTLPSVIIQSLGPRSHASERVRLGDGSVVSTAVFRGRIKLFETWVPILVQLSEGDILAGMALLEGTTLSIAVVRGGEATIEQMESEN